MSAPAHRWPASLGRDSHLMKSPSCFLSHCCNVCGAALVLSAAALFAQGQTPAMDKDFVRTNGSSVRIGNITVKADSPLNTEESKQYMWRVHLVDQILQSHWSNTTERVVETARALIKDYPEHANGYQFIMMATESYERAGAPDKARGLAEELAAGPGPEKFRRWAEGFLTRLNAQGKPVTLRFTALDGRKVDLAEMRGKVVLVDFWATQCAPCVAELPRVKAAFERFHPQGLEIIGISCDTDKKRLEDYVQKCGIPWAQYFDGKQQSENRFTVEFGVDGIPHMFLLDKKGLLRFDNVRARDDVHSKNNTDTFEDKISKLLAER